LAWSKRDWEKRVREIAQDSGNIIWTNHAQQQMKKRHITFAMATDVLCRGTVQKEPEQDIRTGHMICRMERYCAGEDIGICVALKSEQASKIIVVTAIRFGD